MTLMGLVIPMFANGAQFLEEPIQEKKFYDYCSIGEEMMPAKKYHDYCSIGEEMMPAKKFYDYCGLGEEMMPTKKYYAYCGLGEELKPAKKYYAYCSYTDGLMQVRKFYCHPEQIEISDSTIHVLLEEGVYEIDSLAVDQGGIYFTENMVRSINCCRTTPTSYTKSLC